MVDPMEAIKSLQQAVDARIIRWQECELFPELRVTVDEPNGQPRFTYALIENRRVIAVAILALADPVEGVPCFQIGYAVIESMRGRGIATNTLKQAIEEMQNGLSRTPAKEFYIEAVAPAENLASNRIASKVISDKPHSCTDYFTREASFQYLRKVMCDR